MVEVNGISGEISDLPDANCNIYTE
jgi:hypothetical protein